MADLTISSARLLPGTSSPSSLELVDISVHAGRISAITPHTGPIPGAIDADGAVALPGLWDAHVHFSTHALLAECLQLNASDTLAQVLCVLRRELGKDNSSGLFVAFGFRSATWPQQPTAALLDAISLAPVVIIASDLHSLWCNTAGLRSVGAAHHDSGVLREEDAFAALLHLLRTETAHVDDLVMGAQQRAASRGVVGFVDMEMSWAIGAWQRRQSQRASLQRVEAATYPDDLERLISLELRTGDSLGDLLSVGPLKIISDGSLGSRTAHCLAPYPHPVAGSPNGISNYPTAEMVTLLIRAARHGISAAVHAIGDLACRDALDAFEAAGAGGTIEHAQLIHPDDLPRFAALGVGASVQPAHLLEDEAVLDEVWPTATDRAFALRSLLDAAVDLRFGSDAPVSPLDPWLAMDVAVNTPHRRAQALTPAEALTASTRSRIAVGEPADLVLTPNSREQMVGGEFVSHASLLTVVAGVVSHTQE